MLNLRILGMKKINKEIRDDGLIKKRTEMILAQKKLLRLFEKYKLVIKCWSGFSDTNISF